MPNRIIRENILSSEAVCSLDWQAEVFYRRLLSVVDDYGRFEASASLLRAKCYPLQVDRVREADISRWTAACQKAGLIVLYQGVVGDKVKHFLEVLRFGQQQRTKSKYPSPLVIANDSKENHLQTNAHLVVSVGVVEGVSVVEDVIAQKRKNLPFDALELWSKAFQASRYKKPFEGTKDHAKIVRELALIIASKYERHPDKIFRATCDAYLESEDKWIVQNRHSLKLFREHFPGFIRFAPCAEHKADGCVSLAGYTPSGKWVEPPLFAPEKIDRGDALSKPGGSLHPEPKTRLNPFAPSPPSAASASS